MQPPDQPSVIAGNEPLQEFAHWLNSQNYRGLFVLTDSEVAEEAFPLIEPYLQEKGLKGVLTIPPGEGNKTLECCEDVWHELINNDATRNALLINLGGGLVTDLGGFVASTFKRGMPFVNIPTTLLGMVDAAIGGKTGINFQGLKNQLGVFREPDRTVIAPAFLNTLEDRQLLSGYAEMVKHALIANAGLWQQFRALHPLDRDQLYPHIDEAVQVKQELVRGDPFEHGQRKKLNFGHTIGHALESYSQEHDEDPLLHGEAIAIGMVTEAYLSTQHTLLPDDTYAAVRDYLYQHFPSYRLSDQGVEEVLTIMKADKKRDQEAFNFTLLVEAGQADTDIQLSRDEVKAGLAATLQV
jgi:3-dehydroquinate synthase